MKMVRQYQDEGRIPELSFDLYKEAGSIVILCASAHTGQTPEAMSIPRNQAICAALLTRVAKFMLGVMRLSSGIEHGEVTMALSRCITEAAINVRFLTLKNEDRFFDQFVQFALAPERELYDLITKNITDRQGRQLNIETHILASIERVCGFSGMEIEHVSARHGDWGGGLRRRQEALGRPEAYVLQQRISSHAIHGTWVDLLFHHLEPTDSGFKPKTDGSSTYGRTFGPVGITVLEAAGDYLSRYFGDNPDVAILYERIDAVQQSILKVERADDDWLETEQTDAPKSQEA